ncbi:hypothetical protein [Winogradskyella tangerina]|uniref:hypothetical protein n=1 Tax=Winogradskyella tangerina TaxID=2023240 RepID=UPI000DBE1D36|nr:hypothetical protein [Winogradskyella tangerina]
MHRKLIVAAFDKGKKDLIEKGSKNPSDNAISELIANHINEVQNIQVNSRTLRNYYKEVNVNISRNDIVQALCLYLGFDSYAAFISNTGLTNSKSFLNKFNKSKYIIMIIIVVGLLSALIYFKINEPRFMIWKGDHYEEVDLDLDKYSLSELKKYNQDRIDNLRKIDPQCGFDFFNADNSPRVWYGKNSNKEYEYFTSLGLHPETSKTLKPITDFIIKNHICK